MNQEIKRIGRFTSSQISALMSNGKAAGTMGKPGQTYIAEKNMERRLGRGLSCDTTSRPTSWGKACELRVFELLGLEYQLQHKTVLSHPDYPDFWSGSPDCIKEGVVVEIKSPATLKSFCQLVDPIYSGFVGMDAINAIRFGWKDAKGISHDKHPDADDYFYQIISNAIIAKVDTAELIVYVPLLSELKDIRDWTNNLDGDQKPYAWINFASDNELPWIPDNGFYKNLNVIRFEVPQSAKDELTERVLLASKSLIPIIGEEKVS